MAVPSEGSDECFVALVLMESSSDARDYRPLYEESFILIRATSLGVLDASLGAAEASLRAAEERAVAYARSQEVSYQNEYGETIRWAFKEVVDVKEAFDDPSGEVAELHSRFFRDYEAYYRSLQAELD